MENGFMTVRDLSQLVGVMEKEIFHHLEFIEKTIRSRKKRIGMEPYHCLDCGFKFKNRKKFKKPGRCPKCRDGRIAPAILWIESY